MADVQETSPESPAPEASAATILNNGSEKPDRHPRLSDYKARSIRCSQEERRFNLLLDQKERRSNSFNESRGIIEAITAFDDVPDLSEDEMEWNKIEQTKPATRFIPKLMISEWLLEVPADLVQSWYMVPCPKGKRSLVIATRGSTKAYNKYGSFKNMFPSVLPGGNAHGTGSHGTTVLDCIWHAPSRTFYILDVLAWNNQPLLNCETEFRFFWLRSKIQETEGISEKSDEHNKYPFILLPHYPCEGETLTTIMAIYPPFSDEHVVLDGLLFYHSQCHYECAVTPLVGWLKPFMIPEILNIPVAEEYLAMKPKGYINILEYIEVKNQKKSKQWHKKKKKKRKSKSKEEKMEVAQND